MSARTFLPGCLSAPAFNRLTPQARRGGTLSDRIEQGSFVEARGRPWLVEVVDDLEHRQWLHLRSCRPSMTRRSGHGRFGRDVCLWHLADILLTSLLRPLGGKADLSYSSFQCPLMTQSGLWQTLLGKHRNKAPSKWRGQGEGIEEGAI